MVASIEAMLALHTFEPGQWRPPIVKTEATTGKGVDGAARWSSAFQAHSSRRVRQRRHGSEPSTGSRTAVAAIRAHVERSCCESRRVARSRSHRQPGARSLHARPRHASRVLSDRPRRRPRGDPVLDHVGIAVADIAEALAFYRDALGLQSTPGRVASQRVRAHFIPAGGAALELLEATRRIPRLRRYLRSAAPGFTTSRSRVDDIAARWRAEERSGVRLIDELAAARRARLAGRVHPSGRAHTACSSS
jgi:methylmalonyl-CoA/ethylmalonyl-CoA epimerase